VKEEILAWLIFWVMRLLGRTLRFRIDDRSGLRSGELTGPIIWAFWHNRMCMMPMVYYRFFRFRKGVVLASASKDGAIIAGVVRRFGGDSVRGSSSRRGAEALRELTRWVERGKDAILTPDGPRGPRYVLGAGIISLAQNSGAPVVPISLEYSSYWRLMSWDHFMIPRPFSKVSVVFGAPYRVRPTSTPEEFEAERLRLQEAIMALMTTR
jgi:lysophospholipid acyltransferase (LPLAT)-like uncharacterized protein